MWLMTKRHFIDSLNQPRPPPPEARRTPIAVALQQGDGLPVVSASGRGLLAEQILALALDHGIAVRQDSDLATVLSAVDVDSPIPLEAFAAVAEILSYLYRANGSTLAAGEALEAEDSPS